MIAIKKLILTLQLLVLSACVTAVQEQSLMRAEEPDTLHTKKAWFAVRFSISWNKSLEPDWYLGTLIAGEVITPVLKKQQNIVCWRIHRRAVDDKTGHVFSFIFYSSQADAVIIYQQVKNNEILTALHHQHLLVKIAYDPLNSRQTKIADTSDPVWPEKIRRFWPYFIMGASQMWLEQINAFKKETQNELEITQRYRLVQSKLTELWQQQGKHALLHHLSALYAYEPLLVRF